MRRQLSATPKAFLSYAREDLAVAEMLYADLTRAGVRLWFDAYDLAPGQQWESEITGALQDCSHFLLLISRHSVKKRGHVQKELRMILELAKEFPESASPVIPVFLDRSQFPNAELEKFQRVELYRSYEHGLRQILRSIRPKRPARQLAIAVHVPQRPLWEGDLAKTGWGVIFAEDCDPEIKEALKPLIEHRRAAASWRSEELFRVFDGDQAVRPQETSLELLERCGVGPGSPVVRKVPYYLLLVGDPAQIPFSLQSQLAVQHAVGRLWFDTPEEYAAYAETVLGADRGQYKVAQRTVLFGPANPDDLATARSSDDLVKPLGEALATERLGWEVETITGPEATKARLLRLHSRKERPALLLFAGHGMDFRNGDPRQLSDQGALLCQDWPGLMKWSQRIPEDFYFAARDIDTSAPGPRGMISLFSCCHSAGTPEFDEFSFHTDGSPRRIAPKSFLAGLPRKLLAHPRGGALAVAGKIERMWTHSFLWRDASQIETFRTFAAEIMSGQPVGLAMRSFSLRFAELSTLLLDAMENPSSEPSRQHEWERLRVAARDARNYILLGDPAVRLPLDRD